MANSLANSHATLILSWLRCTCTVHVCWRTLFCTSPNFPMGLYYLNDTGIVFSYHTIPYTSWEGTPYTSYTYCYRYTWLTISSNLVPSLHLLPLGDRGPTCPLPFYSPSGRQGDSVTLFATHS